MMSSAVHTASGKRTGSALQSSAVDANMGSAVKLGQVGRDKERKEKEDVELKPPWDLLPYSKDPSAGELDNPNKFLTNLRIPRLLSFQGNRGRIQAYGKSNYRRL